MERVKHELDPIYNKDSKVLILGSIPSIKSRETGFYYAHPQNRFWKIMNDIFHINLINKEEKVKFLLDNHIALWDVIASCDIKGSSDSSIENVVCNDICGLLKKTEIDTIFCTGKKAFSLYQKYIYPYTQIKGRLLPSSSPANCAISYETLLKEYEIIKEKCIKK